MTPFRDGFYVRDFSDYLHIGLGLGQLTDFIKVRSINISVWKYTQQVLVGVNPEFATQQLCSVRAHPFKIVNGFFQ